MKTLYIVFLTVQKTRILVLTLILFFISVNVLHSQFMSWRRLDLLSIDHVAVSKSGNIFATSDYYRNIYKSIDDGINWITIELNKRIESLDIAGSDSLIWGCETGEVYFSPDGGSTYDLSADFNSIVYTIKYIDLTDSSLILAGTADGYIHISRDFGITWESQPISTGYFRSIRYIQGRIFAATSKGLFFSDNFGYNWESLVILQTDENVPDIESDGTDNLYAGVGNHLYKSTNFGLSWELILEESVKRIKYSHEGEIFAGDYKSVDTGLTWIKIIPATIMDIDFKDSVTYMVDFDGNLYREEVPPYSGQNYYPLSIGNIWQYEKKVYYTTGMNTTINYSLLENEVTGDTSIEGNLYYKLGSSLLRYTEDNKLYDWQDSVEQIIMDFNLVWGDTLEDKLIHDGYVNLFGVNRFWKGFFNHGMDWFSTTKYADSIGYWGYDYTQQWYVYSSSIDINLIDALILNDGPPVYHSNYYKPEIFLTPITTVDTLVLNMSFSVDHTYSKFSTSGSSVNFIDEVWVQFFYAKEGSVTEMDSVSCSISDSSANCFVSISLDSTKFIEDYKFYYSIFATDKAIIPQNSRSPESGFYELIYDPNPSGIEIKDEQIFSFTLKQNYPNPFNPTTNIQFTVNSLQFVTLKVYDVLGNEIATLVNEEKPAGEYEANFDGSGLSSGIYFYRITAGSYRETKKMILLR